MPLEDAKTGAKFFLQNHAFTKNKFETDLQDNLYCPLESQNMCRRSQIFAKADFVQVLFWA